MTIFLIDLYRNHYAPARLLNVNPHTRVMFEIEIERFGKSLGRPATIDDLQTNTISAHLSRVIDEGKAIGTVCTGRKKLVALWRFAHQKRFVQDYPDVPALQEERDPPIAWRLEEASRLIETCRGQLGKVPGSQKGYGGIPPNLWWFSLHMVMFDTGTRIGATLKVEWPCVNLDRGSMLFRASTQKNKRGQLHRLRPETVEALRLIREPARRLVWPYNCDKTLLYYRYKQILELAGLPSDRRSKFHRIRRSVATWFEAAGGNATELLGHASRKHTKDSYLDESQIDRPTPATVLPALGQAVCLSRKVSGKNRGAA